MSSKKESARSKYGLGSIRKTKSGKYEYRFSYYDEYNIRRHKSFTCSTVDECLDAADDFKLKLEQRLGSVTVKSTVSEILHYKAKSDFNKNFTGEQGYKRNLDTIAIIDRMGIGSMKIVDVTPAHLDFFFGSITHYSNNMIRKLHGMMSAAFRIAHDANVIPHNYMLRTDFRCPKSDKKDKDVRGLTEKEQNRFVEALMAHKVPYGRNSYKHQLLIELYSGMRMGEINALTPEDIDLDNGFVHVKATISKGMDAKAFLKDGTKTQSGVRDVPISASLEEVLRDALSSHKENPMGLLFYDHQKDGVIDTNQVNCFYRRICEKAEIPFYGQHALRHTFATRCIEAGIQPVVLKKWLGHASIKITLDTYADVFDRMNTDSMEKFDKLMESIKSGE